MAKKIKDKRLPAHLYIFLNNWNEYVVVSGNKVFQFPDGTNVRCGKTVEEAVYNYLSPDINFNLIT